jgi:hypothetical protein
MQLQDPIAMGNADFFVQLRFQRVRAWQVEPLAHFPS